MNYSFDFGKYKGRKVQEVSEKYLDQLARDYARIRKDEVLGAVLKHWNDKLVSNEILNATLKRMKDPNRLLGGRLRSGSVRGTRAFEYGVKTPL